MASVVAVIPSMPTRVREPGMAPVVGTSAVPVGGVFAYHAALHNPEDKPVTQPTLAYDRLQLPVLAGHLAHDDAAVVHAALVSLRRLITDPAAAAKAHEVPHLLDELAAKSGIIAPPELVSIGRLATECLSLFIASPALRCDTLARPTVAAALHAALKCGDAECRRHAYAATAAAAEAVDSTAALVAGGFVQDLVARVAAEVAACTPAALAVGGGGTRSGAAPGVATLLAGALAALSRMVAHTSTDATDMALVHGAVPALFKCLHLPLPPLRGHLAGGAGDAARMRRASGLGMTALAAVEPVVGGSDDVTTAVHLAGKALMYIAFTTAGKVACIESPGGVALLVALVRSGVPSVVATAALAAIEWVP